LVVKIALSMAIRQRSSKAVAAVTRVFLDEIETGSNSWGQVSVHDGDRTDRETHSAASRVQ
jgi:hypothetical protein